MLLAVKSTAPPHFAVSCVMIPPRSVLLAELVCMDIRDGSLDVREARFPSGVAKRIRSAQR
jgi:hypothetical protein